MCSTRDTQVAGSADVNSLGETKTGPKMGVGTALASSPKIKLIPGSSQGIVTDSTVGVDAHASPITLRRLSASSGLKVSSGSV